MPVIENDHWYYQWLKNFDKNIDQLTHQDARALASLLPMLLCGEQSAVVFFHNKATNAEFTQSHQLLTQIAQDEYIHDQALQKLVNQLPTPTNHHQLKRRSQSFYLSLAKNISVAEQFARIHQLDRAVCKIMHAISKSRIRNHANLSYLFSQISKDEARHSNICKRQALALNLSKTEMEKQAGILRRKLVNLLRPVADYFERLEVDSDKLFNNIYGLKQ